MPEPITVADCAATRLGRHFVQFYKEPSPLLDEVAEFIDSALRAGDAGVVIATAEHRAELARRLQGSSVAVGAAQWYPGEYIAVDAEETLAQFMVEGWPDEDRFTEVVGALIERASQQGARTVCCFGEMVVLLCRQGNHAAAIRLEELWTQRSRHQAFTLFCAYPLDLFARPEQGRAFEAICAHHSHVLPAGLALDEAGSTDLTRAQLQQKTAALEAEVARRVQAEQTLRRREKELADFLENAAEGLNRIDRSGIVLWANRAELELLGREIDEVVGRHVAHFHADPAQGEAFVARLGAGEPVFNQPATLRSKDGSIRHVLIHSTPVLENGQLQCWRCFTRDVTEQVLAREVLQRGHDERVRLLQKVESASRAKDEFLAMLGHELRNPLAPIVTALQLMKMRGDTHTAKEQGIIQRQVDHLTRLVDDLLDVSRITRGKIQLHKQTVEIGEVVAKAIEMTGLLLEQRRHRLVVHAPAQGLRWHGDPVRLAQVVANLLTNAARYTPQGGEVRLSAFRDTGHVVISVQDNGVGIEPKNLTRVFDMFVQGERGVDRAEGGLGIGLALVKSLVAMHGGSVFARSDGLGLGSEFVVRLPLTRHAAEPQPVAPAVAPAVGSARSRLVLVVDDNADAADLLGAALRAQGHQALVVHDPVAALRAVSQIKPDVAVLDIGLPVIDGYELAVQLRAQLGAWPCRFIALTGYGAEADRARSRQAGFEAHLVKPVQLDRLLALVDESSVSASSD